MWYVYVCVLGLEKTLKFIFEYLQIKYSEIQRFGCSYASHMDFHVFMLKFLFLGHDKLILWLTNAVGQCYDKHTHNKNHVICLN